MASMSSSAVRECLGLAFGLAFPLEIRPIPPLAASSVPTSEAEAACTFLGLSARGLDPSSIAALSPAFRSWRIAAKGPGGEVFLIDTWAGQAPGPFPHDLPGENAPSGPGAELLEAYLGWVRGQSYRLEAHIAESLVSLYTLVVHAGLDARLLAICGPSIPEGPEGPRIQRLQDLGVGTELATRLCVLCPQGEISALPALPRASAWSWRRALG